MSPRKPNCAIDTHTALARGALNADKPHMARPDVERSTLKPLVAALSREYRTHERAWSELLDPRVLRRFRRELDAAAETLNQRESLSDPLGANRADRMRSMCAELLIGARLLAHGCTLEHEAETPSGKHVDFRASKNGVMLNVHVKRAPRLTLHDAHATVTHAWRALEHVQRGLVIALSISQSVRGRSLAAALEQARDFVEQASVGDELTLNDAHGQNCARVRAIAPSPTGHIELVPDLSASFDEHVPRFQATLRKAFSQFMPRSENLIVVCGSAGGFEPFATALLGSHIERWDKRPRVGELVAYGRGGDGFWAGAVRNQSRLAVYWTLARHTGPLLFVRNLNDSSVSAKSTSDRARSALSLAREIFA